MNIDSNYEFKKNYIKNRTWYYCDDIIKIEDFNLDNILINKKSYENIFVCNVSYKTLSDAKLLRISFDKLDGFIRVYDGNRYLVLFASEKYDLIYNRIKYFIRVKNGIKYFSKLC